MSRRICTPDNPYSPERDTTEPGYGWEHEKAHEVGEQIDGYPGGDIVKMKCDTCGVTWRTELPQ